MVGSVYPRKFEHGQQQLAATSAADPCPTGSSPDPQVLATIISAPLPSAPLPSALLASSTSPPLPFVASSGNRAQDRDCDFRVVVAPFSSGQHLSLPSSVRVHISPFSLPGCIHRRTVVSSIFHLRVVYRKYYNRTSSLSIRVFALSRATSRNSRTPTTPSTLHATARHLPTWVSPLCFAGSARNTPRSCLVL